MAENPIILYPTDVYNLPRGLKVVACVLVTAPRILLKPAPLTLYLPEGRIKNIVLESEEMINRPLGEEVINNHGFIYTGDTITQKDLQNFPLISNLPFDQAVYTTLRVVLDEWRDSQADALQKVWRAILQTDELKDWGKNLQPLREGRLLSPVGS